MRSRAESQALRGVAVLGVAVLGVRLSSADQCRIADTAGQFCLGSAPDSPTRSLTRVGKRQTARAQMNGPQHVARSNFARKTSGGSARE